MSKTTGFIVGQKTGIITAEVVKQTVSAPAGFFVGFARNAGINKAATVIKDRVSTAVKNASTPEAKDARALKAEIVKGKLGAIASNIGARIPISVEIKDAVESDIARVKGMFAEIDLVEAPIEEEDDDDAVKMEVTRACGHKEIINTSVSRIENDIAEAGTSLCDGCIELEAQLEQLRSEPSCEDINEALHQ